MKTTLKIIDEINCRFLDLPPDIRRKLIQETEYVIPGAAFTPAVRLRSMEPAKCHTLIFGGRTYLNLLDRLLPIVQAAGYEIEIEDERTNYNFTFDKIDKNSYSHISWPEGHTRAGQPIELLDHQLLVINTFLENPQGVVIAPTGSGKTISCAILSHKCEPYRSNYCDCAFEGFSDTD